MNLKKLSSLSIALLILTVPLFGKTILIREDDFESYETGLVTAPDGAKLKSAKGGFFQQAGRWAVSGTSNVHRMEILETTDKNGKSTRAFSYRKAAVDSLAGGVIQTMGGPNPFPVAAGIFTYEASLKLGDEKTAPFRMVTFGRFVRLEAGGQLSFMQTDGRTTVSTDKKVIPEKIWFSFKAEFDMATSQITVRVNGEKIRAQPYPAEAFANLPLPRWDFGGYGKDEAVFFLDDVKMVLQNDEVETVLEKFVSYENAPLAGNPVLDFETSGWVTAPPDIPKILLKNGMSEDDLLCSRGARGKTWDVKKVSFESLSRGLILTNAHASSGKMSGLWKDHEKVPTLACENFNHDWSAFKTFEISIFSEKKTGEVITLGLLSDTDKTPHKDYFLTTIVVDWTGEKILKIPLASFQKYEEPAGLSKIDGIYFFTKAFGGDPHPYTALYLDHIRLTQEEVAAIPQPTVDPFVYKLRYPVKTRALNHTFPETTNGGILISPEKSISHQPYFQTERALYKYFPRFNPGFPSFDPKGKAFLNAGETIEWVNEKGIWESSDIKSVIIDWAKKRGWAGVDNKWGGQGADTAIRFDKDGDAYVLEMVEALDETGKPVNWTNRTTLLLHSRDKMKTWAAYALPGRVGCFEKIDGHNTDALKRPPVILLSDYKYQAGSDKSQYILLPEKKKDGTLSFPKPVNFIFDGVGINYHSGDATVAVTVGDKIFIAYGWCPMSIEYPAERDALAKKGAPPWGNWTTSLVRELDIGKTMPAIPEGNPALTYEVKMKWGQKEESWYTKDGVPTYVVAYDLKTKTLSAPVFVGMGGAMLDEHNVPAINVDSKGFLHVIINGHHNPVMYTRSASPLDISKWTEPYLIHGQLPRLSYATFTCDKNDTLISVHRSTTEVYNNALAMYQKKSGSEWEAERTLVAPFYGQYKAWYHKMAYDSKRDRLFLTYYDIPNMFDVTWDTFEFFSFYYMDEEKPLSAGKGQNGGNKGRFSPKEAGNHFFGPRARDLNTIVSEDGGAHWRLAVTADFMEK